jgi:hypothetical protein
MPSSYVLCVGFGALAAGDKRTPSSSSMLPDTGHLWLDYVLDESSESEPGLA